MKHLYKIDRKYKSAIIIDEMNLMSLIKLTIRDFNYYRIIIFYGANNSITFNSYNNFRKYSNTHKETIYKLIVQMYKTNISYTPVNGNEYPHLNIEFNNVNRNLNSIYLNGIVENKNAKSIIIKTISDFIKNNRSLYNLLHIFRYVLIASFSFLLAYSIYAVFIGNHIFAIILNIIFIAASTVYSYKNKNKPISFLPKVQIRIGEHKKIEDKRDKVRHLILIVIGLGVFLNVLSAYLIAMI